MLDLMLCAPSYLRRAGRPAIGDSPMDTLKGADVLIFVTEWQSFSSQDFGTVKSLRTHTVIFNGRNLFEQSLMWEAGFEYFPIGRTG